MSVGATGFFGTAYIIVRGDNLHELVRKAKHHLKGKTAYLLHGLPYRDNTNVYYQMMLEWEPKTSVLRSRQLLGTFIANHIQDFGNVTETETKEEIKEEINEDDPTVKTISESPDAATGELRGVDDFSANAAAGASDHASDDASAGASDVASAGASDDASAGASDDASAGASVVASADA
jgi:hypothetical protein